MSDRPEAARPFGWQRPGWFEWSAEARRWGIEPTRYHSVEGLRRAVLAAARRSMVRRYDAK